MRNLLEETKEIMKMEKLNPNEIIFIGSESSGHSYTWEEFELLSNIEYDNSYGGQKIATDLIIVFKNRTVMVRGEYDGSEWWEVIEPFKMPKKKLSISTYGIPY
jgi:hypothetical protein